MSQPTTTTKQPPIELSPAAQATFDLITRNLDEVLLPEIIKEKLSKNEVVKCYWGTAPTGRPHLGYFVPLTKIADFLKAGVAVTVLLADNGKSTYETVAHRVSYYSKLLHAIFTSLGVPTEKLSFVTGSEYQLSKEYSLDNFRLCALTTLHDATKAGAEVVKQIESPFLSSLMYPGMQALDEQYLGVDFQFGGVDQRKIFTMAQEYLPKLGYAKRAHLMNAMVPGLAGGKMSSSDPNSKIDFLDSPADVKKKIKVAFCEPTNVTENGLLSFHKAVLVPIQVMKRNALIDRGEDPDAPPHREALGIAAEAPAGTVVSIARAEKWGGPLFYPSYESMESDFAADKLKPADLKLVTVDMINALLDPIRRAFEADEEWRGAEAKAYPKDLPPVKGGKKVKEKKPKEKQTKPEPSAEEFIASSKHAAEDNVVPKTDDVAVQLAVVNLADGEKTQ
ncbi:hypothetical protein QFC24_002518 [Naganishia onofrii]|uniref:Uncharacterized protein n=1 Tax=Naganishia onofrii TaxID=1851511 RepID=A0ACC2XQJ0_9TREE|nr:hypothetical protein QFC24_002518 [Naganishia onofrii]